MTLILLHTIVELFLHYPGLCTNETIVGKHEHRSVVGFVSKSNKGNFLTNYIMSDNQLVSFDCEVSVVSLLHLHVGLRQLLACHTLEDFTKATVFKHNLAQIPICPGSSNSTKVSVV